MSATVVKTSPNVRGTPSLFPVFFSDKQFAIYNVFPLDVVSFGLSSTKSAEIESKQACPPQPRHPSPLRDDHFAFTHSFLTQIEDAGKILQNSGLLSLDTSDCPAEPDY